MNFEDGLKVEETSLSREDGEDLKVRLPNASFWK